MLYSGFPAAITAVRKCQNPITWDPNGGIPFNQEAKEELFKELGKSYVSGITLSGGDPLPSGKTVWISVHWCMRSERKFPTKTIWLYTRISVGTDQPF